MPTYCQQHMLHNVEGVINHDWANQLPDHIDALKTSPLNRTDIPPILEIVADAVELESLGGLAVECTNKKFKFPGILTVLELGQVMDLAYPEAGRLVSHDHLMREARRQKNDLHQQLGRLLSHPKVHIDTWLIPASQIQITR